MIIVQILIAFAVLSVLWGVVSAMFIVSYLRGREVSVNFLLIRLLIFKYIHQYKEMTEQESGKPGFWYYSYITSMILALLLVIAALLLNGS